MSRERSHSLDRSQRKQQQRENLFPEGTYVPERSPYRTALGSRTYDDPKHVPSSPELYHRNYGGDSPRIVSVSVDDENRKKQVFESIQSDVFMQRGFEQLEDLPGEFLEQFEAPSFYDDPADSSFREVMCTMATPPPAPKASEALDDFRSQIADIVQVDDVRRRMAEHIGKPSEEQSTDIVQIDDVRKRMATILDEAPAEAVLCPNKIPPLPEDPYAIPPPPKDPTDIVAIIRRAQAIARLKAIEEAKTPRKPQEKPGRGGKRPVSSIAKPTPRAAPKAVAKAPSKVGTKAAAAIAARAKLLKAAIPRKTGPPVKKPAECPPTPQHPPDYVPEDWAAAILRTRKLAGLKTTNPKLLAKTITPLPPKTPLPQVYASPLQKQPTPPPPPTYDNIMQRIAAIRLKTEAARASTGQRIPSPEIKLNDLDEFEALELLYDAKLSDQSPVLEQSTNDLQNRIVALQRQLFTSPPRLDSSPRSPRTPATPRTPIKEEDIEDFEALEELYGADPYAHDVSNEDFANDLQDRINALHQKLLQSPELRGTSEPRPIYEIPSILRYQDLLQSREAMAAAAAQPGLIQRLQIESHPESEASISRTPLATEACSRSGTLIRPQSSSLPEIVVTPPSPRRAVPTIARPGTPTIIPRPRPRATPKMTRPCPQPEISTISPQCTRLETLVRTPARFRPPKATSPVCPPQFDEAYLNNLTVPDFDVNEIPEFAFSAEVLMDAGFVIDNETSLDEVSMPSFGGDISLDELGLEDVTSPELCDLLISDESMALEPDYPLEITSEEEDGEAAEKPDEPGFLTSMVNAVVGRFRNMFTPTKSDNVQIVHEDENELDLDTSLPNMFEITPLPKPETPPPKEPEPAESVVAKPPSPDKPIVIPPHPKDPKDYMAMVKRAQAIQRKRAQEEVLEPPPPDVKERKGKKQKPEVKSSIPKRAPPSKKKEQVKNKKEEIPAKVYPPGEYSPSDARAVARARSIAGYKNLSALLNPERAARIAARQAAREAELAAIEALPPVERMRKKMEGMRKRVGSGLPKPSLESLATLEAIRCSLPIPKPPVPKWRPAGRLRADYRVRPEERIFTSDFGRVLIPTKKTQKKKGWREIDVMSPITEEPGPKRNDDFMEFSPLKPHEGHMRLQYLKEQTARRVAEMVKNAKEAQEAVSLETTPRQRFKSPGRISETSPMAAAQFSPIQFHSPSSPRKEETTRKKLITKIGPNGGEETIREEITETSMIQNGEVHTSTRQVTTKTDEYGNVTTHIQEGKGLSGEEEASPQNLSDIEPPDFMDTSYIPPPRDPSIPTPSEIIERIRANVQQKLTRALPDITEPPSPSPASPGIIELPQDVTDEDLFEIEVPEFERTPPRASPQAKIFSPIEKDERMYAWGEVPPPTPPPRMPTPPLRIPTPKVSPEPVKQISLLQKSKSPEVICIPPHPEYPKDYVAMVKRAQAIYKLKKQQEALEAATALPPTEKEKGRVPISRWVAPPPKDSKKPPRKRMVLKKKVPKVEPKVVEPSPEEEEEGERECPTEPPPLPDAYREAVARARLIHGLKNKTAALNPIVAAKLAAKKAAEEAAKAAYDALPENEKIKRRMEEVRKIPPKKRRIDPSAEILGTIAAIRGNMPPIEEVLKQPSPQRSPILEEVSVESMLYRTPSSTLSPRHILEAPKRVKSRSASPSPTVDVSLDEFEFMEQYMEAMPETPEVCVPVEKVIDVDEIIDVNEEVIDDESLQLPDISCLRPYVSPEQTKPTSATRPRTPSPSSARMPSPDRVLSPLFTRLPSPARMPLPLSTRISSPPRTPKQFNAIELSLGELEEFGADISLKDFEKLEAEIEAEEKPAQDTSLDEFEALEAEAVNLYDYETPTRAERHFGRTIAHEFPIPSHDEPDVPDILRKRKAPSPACLPQPETSPVPFVTAPSMRQLVETGFYDQLWWDEVEAEVMKPIERPKISPMAGAFPGTIFYDPMQDFQVPVENIELETSQLMPETPPKNIQERLERLKRAHEKPTIQPQYNQQIDDAPETIAFSPITLFSPSDAPCIAERERNRISPTTFSENELLVDLKGKGQIGARRFQDLEDMPFDELEYEIQPSFADISLEKPMTPPPKPSDIIRRIRGKVKQELQEQAILAKQMTPKILEMPEDLPDEELFEMSAPSFARTPPRTPSPKHKSPRISLPMAWGEVRPETPVTPPTPPLRTITPPRIPTPVVEEIEEKLSSPDSPIVIPPHPEDPKDYAAMVKRAQAIYKLKKQQEAQEAAKAPPPPAAKKGRVPLSRWLGPPPKKETKKPRKKLVLRKKSEKPLEELQKLVPRVPGEEEECPVEPPELSQDYRDAVARARLLHGLKNKTAALNPKIAAKVAAKKAAEEAAQAAYDALPENEKIRIRMERLRKKHQRRGVKATMEQIAYVEALKQIGDYKDIPSTPPKLSLTPRATKSPTPQRIPLTPQKDLSRIGDLRELSEFEALKQLESVPPVCPRSSLLPDDHSLENRFALQHGLQVNKMRSNFDIDSRIQKLEQEFSPKVQEMTELDMWSIYKKLHKGLDRRRKEMLKKDLCPIVEDVEEDIEFEMSEAEAAELDTHIDNDVPQMGDISLAEFEALEAVEAPVDHGHGLVEERDALDMNQIISDLQQQQLVTPPRVDPREKFKQLLAQRKTPKTPVVSPVKTPEIRYSPLTLSSSPFRDESRKRAETTTTQITRSGNNTIEEQVVETSEIVNGELQKLTTHITTTTDPQGEVTCQINETKRISARDLPDELQEDIGEIQEPSFLDTTPVTPIERPRPRDIIDRISRQVKEAYVPVCPTGTLVELRTPPPMLPLPENIPEEDLLNYSAPSFERTPPTRAPVHSSIRSPIKTPDISIPHLFASTPPPPTPPLPPVSPLRHRVHSPEGPIVIPDHPKDPADFQAMVRRARKIQELMKQKEDEERATVEMQEAMAAAAAAEAAKPKKKERVPISRWKAPPPKKEDTKKKLVMKKSVDPAAAKTPGKHTKTPGKPPQVEEEEDRECPAEPPPLPEHFAVEVALARKLAGLKNRTAVLNPKVAAREAAKAAARSEALRKVQEAEAARMAILNAPPPSPITDYAKALSRMKELKEKGAVRRGEPSIASVAYLNALKGAMQVLQHPVEEVSPKTRLQKIMTERAIAPPVIEDSPIRTPSRDDIPYTPVRIMSPRIDDQDFVYPSEDYQFNVAAFENLDELEELGEFEEPGLINVSSGPLTEGQYTPITPPRSPPPAPSAIISRIRREYEQQQAAIQRESQISTPVALEFPEDLPEEELFELSAPSFAKSPIRLETPVRSPNISLPRYFETTPPPSPVRALTPKSITSSRTKTPVSNILEEAKSPELLGVCPGIKVKTPEGPIVIPPHPKDPTDVAAMIRRAQYIQKLQAKEAAEKEKAAAAAKAAAKARVPISRKAPVKGLPTKGVIRKLILTKKKVPDTKAKTAATISPRDIPKKPPELPADYVAEVARARQLAGLKNKTALFNQQVLAKEKLKFEATPQKVLAREKAKLEATPQQSDYAIIMELAAALKAAKGTPPREATDYATVMERAAALRAAKGTPPQIATREPVNFAALMEKAAALKEAKKKQAPSAKELLIKRKMLMNRLKRQQGRRQMQELIRLRRQGIERPNEPQITKTPLPTQERFQAIKSRIISETPISSQYPYSPVKTPDITELPQYQALVLPPTPPYMFLDNVCIPDIGDTSMPFEDLDKSDMDLVAADVDDMEFQMAEAQAAELDDDINVDALETAHCPEINKMERNFDIESRIRMLEQELSPRVQEICPKVQDFRRKKELLNKDLRPIVEDMEEDIEFEMAEAEAADLDRNIEALATLQASETCELENNLDIARRIEILQQGLYPTAEDAEDIEFQMAEAEAAELDRNNNIDAIATAQAGEICEMENNFDIVRRIEMLQQGLLSPTAEDAEDIEFQIAEAEAAELDRNINIDALATADGSKIYDMQNNFDIARKIEMLQQRLFPTAEDVDDMEFQMAEAEAAEFDRNINIDALATDEASEMENNFDIARRIEMLEQGLSDSPEVKTAAVDQYNIAHRLEMLERQMFETSSAAVSPKICPPTNITTRSKLRPPTNIATRSKLCPSTSILDTSRICPPTNIIARSKNCPPSNITTRPKFNLPTNVTTRPKVCQPTNFTTRPKTCLPTNVTSTSKTNLPTNITTRFKTNLPPNISTRPRR